MQGEQGPGAPTTHGASASHTPARAQSIIPAASTCFNHPISNPQQKKDTMLTQVEFAKGIHQPTAPLPVLPESRPVTHTTPHQSVMRASPSGSPVCHASVPTRVAGLSCLHPFTGPASHVTGQGRVPSAARACRPQQLQRASLPCPYGGPCTARRTCYNARFHAACTQHRACRLRSMGCERALTGSGMPKHKY
jgi:hypothetical protein